MTTYNHQLAFETIKKSREQTDKVVLRDKNGVDERSPQIIKQMTMATRVEFVGKFKLIITEESAARAAMHVSSKKTGIKVLGRGLHNNDVCKKLRNNNKTCTMLVYIAHTSHVYLITRPNSPKLLS